MFDNAADGGYPDNGLGIGADVNWYNAGPWAATSGVYAPCCYFSVTGSVYSTTVITTARVYVRGALPPTPTTTATASVTPTPTPVSPTPSANCLIGLSASSPALSCADAYNACGFGDGVVWVRPAGTTYLAVCAAGGWTLAAKIDGTQQTFAYANSIWTNAQLLNPSANSVGLVAEAKLQPFIDSPGDTIRVIMSVNGVAGAPLILSTGPFSSLTALFSGGYTATSATPAAWHALVPGGGTYQNNCNLQGVNVVISTGSLRLGIFTNNEVSELRTGWKGRAPVCRRFMFVVIPITSSPYSVYAYVYVLP